MTANLNNIDRQHKNRKKNAKNKYFSEQIENQK